MPCNGSDQVSRRIGSASRGVALALAAVAVLGGCRHDNPPASREIVWADARTEALARRACYDCHSNETEWRWYAYAPIVGSLVTGDVHRGRCHMNFSHWDGPNEEAWEAPEKVLEGEMPLAMYRMAHKEARLTDEERRELADGLRRTFAADPPQPGEPCEDDDDDDDDDDRDDDDHDRKERTMHTPDTNAAARAKAWTTAAAILAIAPSAFAEPTSYQLDPSEGQLYVLVRYERGGLFSAFGHDHVVVAQTWSGTVAWDAADPSRCNVQIDLPVTGLAVDPGDARSWEGLDGTTSASDKATIAENFRGEKQLDASRFPTIRYRSVRCEAAGDHVEVTGDLTIHGVSRRITVPMQIEADGQRFSASGSFDASHGDFGMNPFKAVGGALRNDDLLSFVIDVRGQAR